MPLSACPYLPLINTFDCIAWVPTIRGGLSLSLIDDSKSIQGDVDKYSVEFKELNGFESTRYLAASSLFTFEDSKLGKHFSRTFRFLFRGTINEKQRLTEVVENLFEDKKEAVDLFQEKDFLIGKLSFLPACNIYEEAALGNLDSNDNVGEAGNTDDIDELTRKEADLIELLKKLSDEKRKYTRFFSVESASCAELDNQRALMKSIWLQVEEKMKAIEGGLNNKPVYKFDVVLSKDGILFLREDTDRQFKTHYIQQGTSSDFTQNIPIHRIFKTAMNFIKYLFHCNYHHQEEHDTFLPVTNLHPIRGSGGNLSKIVKHQIEAFLTPVTKMKRDGLMTYSCNPIGVLLYAESFLFVFEENNFLKHDEAHLLRKFINQQKKEMELLLSENKAVVTSFLTQKNLLSTITVGLAFVLATINVVMFTAKGLFPEINQLSQLTLKNILPYAFIVCGAFGAGIAVQNYTIRTVFLKRFIRKKKKNYYLNRDSNLQKRKFSRCYSLRLQLIEIKLHLKQAGVNIVEVVGIIILMFMLSGVYRWILDRYLS